MPFIRTILGDIDASQLGVCYAHEHIVIDESYTTEQTPDFLLADVERIVAELQLLRNAGCRSVVDSMPGGGAGRNVMKLAEVSRRSGLNIVSATGLHLSKYYPHGHWGSRLSAHQLAEVFVAEIQQGIDVNDLAGPDVRRSPHKAGVIKVAGGLDKLSAHERNLFTAAAVAQVQTGCPILTHTEQGTAAIEQIVVLQANGADLSHVVLSHTDRNPDLAYHRKVLSSGVRVEFDSAFRWKPTDRNNTFDVIVELFAEFPNQIMLGMDAARARYWKSFDGGPGLTFLLDTFAPRLRGAGLSEQDLHRIFVSTPASAFAFHAG